MTPRKDEWNALGIFQQIVCNKFQAGCLAKRMEQDGWIYGHNEPAEVEVYRSKKGRYGVRFIP